ncbi:hypothetical protein OKW42_008278 [Paraburkholderia sp. WC7.3d]|uniref:Helix-turn-helix domain-containing protein n=1 Tax=Paraburkholderia podalyriae TaxID=1938811 RepID=A0ABR7Q028_9BURK|nr:helix-turn-helix domain-containing protein [Paraburkholderia podalyriae]
MREDDGRQLSHATLEEIRIRAVKRIEAGESPEDVIRTLGFSRARIYEWLAAWRDGGSRLTSQGNPWSADEALVRGYPLRLSDDHNEEPHADEVRVCIVDARHGAGVDSRTFQRQALRGVGRSTAAQARAFTPAAACACLPTRPPTGRVMDAGRISGHCRAGQTLRGTDLLRRRIDGAIGLSQRHDLGTGRSNTGSRSHWRALRGVRFTDIVSLS